MVPKLDTESKRAHAAMLFNDPLFNEIMDGMEAAEINVAIYAAPTDHEERHACLTRAKAIRTLRAKLNNLAALGDAEAE